MRDAETVGAGGEGVIVHIANELADTRFEVEIMGDIAHMIPNSYERRQQKRTCPQ
jgi:hypothetical protein